MFCLVRNTDGKIMCSWKKFLHLYEAIAYWCPATSVRAFDQYCIRYLD